MAYSQADVGSSAASDAIQILVAASKTPSRTRTTKLGPIVDELCEHAYQSGLSEDELGELLQLATTRNELDQTTITTVIKNLYPASKVRNEIVITIVSALGQSKRKPPASVQVALVRWLIAVYDVLQDATVLCRFYGLLFNLLDTISLRPMLCQLLSVVTKRRHVRPFRIQRLLELAHQTANEPALIVLLRVYKNFCPDVVIISTTAKLPQSMLPDPEWQSRLRTIQQSTVGNDGEGANHGGFRVARHGANDAIKRTIPEVHTFHASEDRYTLEEVRSASELIRHLELIELPSQTVAILNDPLFQKYLQLASSTELQQRLNSWLTMYFEEELQNIREGFGFSPSLPLLLASVISYTRSSKILNSSVEQFLRAYLPLWNGSSDLHSILGLLSFLPPQPFPQLSQTILLTMEQSIFVGTKTPFSTLLEFYADLARHWINAKSSINAGHTSRAFVKSNAIYDMMEHVSLLAEAALAAGQPAEGAIINFYQSMADLISDQILQGEQVLAPVLPPQPLVYMLATTPSLCHLSRLCELLVTYKRCFEKQEAGITRQYQLNAIDLLNGFLMDICNMIWRSRALNYEDTNAAGLLCPGSVSSSLQTYLSLVEREYSIHTMFDFSHNPMIASLSQSALSNQEDEAQINTSRGALLHAGPATQRSLIVLEKEGGLILSWKQYRLEVLDWLELYGLDGFKRLIFGTMKNVIR